MSEERQKARAALKKAIREGGNDEAVDDAIEKIFAYFDAKRNDGVNEANTERNH